MSREYHLAELRIALDSKHPKHILPPSVPATACVLDIGCGAGQSLIAAYPDRVTFGVDVDFDALQLGLSLTRNVRFSQAAAEALPYRSGQFDLVISRVALPYTKVSSALREIRRVLKPGGLLWVTLHGFSIPWKEAKSGNWKAKMAFAYVVGNSLLFHTLQRQLTLLGHREIFFTNYGVTRALARTGFRNISIRRSAHFLVTAEADRS